MIGYYDYSVLLTYFSLISSFVGITYIIDGNVLASCVCLLISGIFDTFDGKIAATKQRSNKQKRFGIQIDSLSDIVCFGVLPATITYELGGWKNHFVLTICCFFVLSAMIRLAYYNVDEEQRQSELSNQSRQYFLGLPVTVSAFVLPLVLLIATVFNISSVILSAASILIMGIAYISPIKVRKLNFTLIKKNINKQGDHFED